MFSLEYPEVELLLEQIQLNDESQLEESLKRIAQFKDEKLSFIKNILDTKNTEFSVSYNETFSITEPISAPSLTPPSSVNTNDTVSVTPINPPSSLSPPPSKRGKREQKILKKQLELKINAPENAEILQRLGIRNLLKNVKEVDPTMNLHRKQIGEILASLGLKTERIQRRIRGKVESTYFIDVNNFLEKYRLSRNYNSKRAEQIDRFENEEAYWNFVCARN